MDIIAKSLEVWKSINDPLTSLHEKRFIFDNECVGKENNCLSSILKSVIILDGELNQLHVIKSRKDTIFHQVVLMTPQPLEKFRKMEMSPSKIFVALVGNDSVSLIDISSLSSVSKTCKKLHEVFVTKDRVISVKWYPNMQEYLAILTTQSINIFHISSDLKSKLCYEFHLYEEIEPSSKSFGIKELFVAFDFGSSRSDPNDNTILILKESGEVYLFPEYRELSQRGRMSGSVTPSKILFDPVSTDNYQDDFCDLLVFRGLVDILVLANRYGNIQHALYLNQRICVYESVTLESTRASLEIALVPDLTAYPPRYFLAHPGGLESLVMTWAIRVRLGLAASTEQQLESHVTGVDPTVLDHLVKTDMIASDRVAVKFAGLVVVRDPSKTPQIWLFQCRDDSRKMAVDIALRPECSTATDVTTEVLDPELRQQLDRAISKQTRDKESRFMAVFRAELNKTRRMPILASGFDGKDSAECDKLALVLQMNDIAGEYEARLAAAGKVFEQRLNQIKSIVQLQKEQLVAISSDVVDMKTNAGQIASRFERALSRQQNVMERLSNCCHKMSEVHGVSARADREATNIVVNVHKRLASINALLRSCRLRFEQVGDLIDPSPREVVSKSKSLVTTELLVPYDRALKEVLARDQGDINRLVADLNGLLRI